MHTGRALKKRQRRIEKKKRDEAKMKQRKKGWLVGWQEMENLPPPVGAGTCDSEAMTDVGCGACCTFRRGRHRDGRARGSDRAKKRQPGRWVQVCTWYLWNQIGCAYQSVIWNDL